MHALQGLVIRDLAISFCPRPVPFPDDMFVVLGYGWPIPVEVIYPIKQHRDALGYARLVAFSRLQGDQGMIPGHSLDGH